MKNTETNWILLRQLVTVLGEYKKWWPTEILIGSGVDFLAYVLPKTKTKAAFQLATEICRSEHDKHIGSGKYHLYRLPQKWEEQMFSELNAQVETFKVLQESEALQQLLNLSEGVSASVATGPLLIGVNSELNDKSVFQSFAKHYYEAFKNNFKTYPYLN